MAAIPAANGPAIVADSVQESVVGRSTVLI